MKIVNSKECVLKEIRFSQQAVRLESARKVINNDIWCFRPPGIDRGEDIVSSLSHGNAVKTV